jgi:hypothetical protein
MSCLIGMQRCLFFSALFRACDRRLCMLCRVGKRAVKRADLMGAGPPVGDDPAGTTARVNPVRGATSYRLAGISILEGGALRVHSAGNVTEMAHFTIAAVSESTLR